MHTHTHTDTHTELYTTLKARDAGLSSEAPGVGSSVYFARCF